MRTANPFTAVAIGFCDAYLYCKGVLCYTINDHVRLLDLHHSSQNEIVISIPGILTQVLLELGDHSNGNFKVLYCADYILSCVYKSSGPDSTAWLIVFNARFRTVITVKELESMDKIFVRHNKKYIFYGTHSEIGSDGYRKWVVCGYDIEARKWFDQKVHFPNMVGSEIGSTICFEFHDDYFYALSNQTSFEVEEIDWTSFYHVVRFPLSSPCKDLVENTENGPAMWRRQHQEGPIDDRWTSLHLDVDHATNELKIVESRKEWHLGASRSQRTFYTTPIKFPELLRVNKEEGTDISSSDDDYNLTSTIDQSSPQVSSPSRSTSVVIATLPTSEAHPPNHHHNFESLPDVPLKNLLQSSDNPRYIHPPPRLAHRTHPSNDSASTPTYTLANSRLRTYHPSSSTFIDLVNSPLPSDWQNRQRLQLRVGGRKLAPTLIDPVTKLLKKPSPELEVALKELYVEEEIRFWPPNDGGEEWEEVSRLLNPPDFLGDVEGVGDEMGMVYVTGTGVGGPKQLVFVGFDPGMRLKGVRKWCGGKTEGDGSKEDEEKEIENVVVDRKGKGKSVSVSLSDGDFAGTTASSNGSRTWAWREKAMYQDIGLGYWFGM